MLYIFNKSGLLDKKITYLTTNNKKEVVSAVDTTSYTYDMNGQLIEELNAAKKSGFRYIYK